MSGLEIQKLSEKSVNKNTKTTKILKTTKTWINAWYGAPFVSKLFVNVLLTS